MRTMVAVDEVPATRPTVMSHVVTVEVGSVGCPIAQASTHARAEVVKAAFDRWAAADPKGLAAAMQHAAVISSR